MHLSMKLWKGQESTKNRVFWYYLAPYQYLCICTEFHVTWPHMTGYNGKCMQVRMAAGKCACLHACAFGYVCMCTWMQGSMDGQINAGGHTSMHRSVHSFMHEIREGARKYQKTCFLVLSSPQWVNAIIRGIAFNLTWCYRTLWFDAKWNGRQLCDVMWCDERHGAVDVIGDGAVRRAPRASSAKWHFPMWQDLIWHHMV